MKNITILGSTGSIGTQTLEVIEKLNDWQVKILTAYQNIDLLYEQIKKFKPEVVVVVEEKAAIKLAKKIKLEANIKTKVIQGQENLISAASEEVDLVLNAIVGFAGLKPSIAAAKASNDIALANKESLVSGGSILTDLVKKNKIKLLPVDSEHNAIFQLLRGHQSELDEIILTASGGPFYDYNISDLKKVSVEDALNHPNWEMGSKITIDSATLMNKGLEVIEAHWLFDLDYEKIKVSVHPQSIVHSLIKLIDGTILAEMGPADMKMPIQYCITYPNRKKITENNFKLENISSLEFLEADTEKFPNLKYAYQAGKAGGSYPVVLNAANEIAVANFLEGKIPFLAINKVVSTLLEKHNKITDPNLDEILREDKKARKDAAEVVQKWF